jgi:hypothetical protein
VGNILLVGNKSITVDFPVDLTLKPPLWVPRTQWVRQIILHKTLADDPENILGGAGPAGGALTTVQAWHDAWVLRRTPDGAHAVVDFDGTFFQLCDLTLMVTEHAQSSNGWSIGIEMKEKVGGMAYMATLQSTVKAIIRIAREAGVQLQMPRLGSYTGHPIPRMNVAGPTPGGPDMVGIFGHRDNTEQRGRWDPGDRIFQMLSDAGVEQFDFAGGEDIATWRERQAALGIENPDGIPGPQTVAALKTAGYIDGIYALGRTV